MMTILYWLFCFSFAFDFRGEKGGSAVQYLFMVLALGAGVLMIFLTPRAMRGRPTNVMLGVWAAYLVSTLIIAMISHVVVAQYLRCVLPPLLFGIGVAVGQNLIARRYTIEEMLRPLLWAGIASVIWRFVFAVIISKIPIDEVRYEMLSPAIPLLFAAALGSAVLAPKMQALPVAGGLFAIASVLVSVTRSFIITLVVGVISIIVAVSLTAAAKHWSTKDIRGKMLHMLAGGILVTVALLVLYIVQPVVFERWFERLFNHGGGRTVQDVTYLTRAAEAKAIWTLLQTDPWCFVYGKGLGANYYWDTSYYPELLQVYPDVEDLQQDIWTPGHSVWTYALFTGGAYAAFSYAFIFGWLVYTGIAAGRLAARHRVDTVHLAYLPFVSGLCYFSQTLTSNPFCERFSAQILGLLAAMPQIYYQLRAVSSPHSESWMAGGMNYPLYHASPTAHRAG